jgi:hypothetical protein
MEESNRILLSLFLHETCDLAKQLLNVGRVHQQ